jgi:formylglycine-generating enzyme required for sulfatase activity
MRSRSLALPLAGLIAAALLAVGLLVVEAHAQQGQQPPAWPAERYNPRPADGDVLLPLPCGGQMAFRRVEVPTAPGPLEDREITVGGSDPDTAYIEHVRPDYLAAPFTAQDGTHFFLIGKYDVTHDQYAAVTERTCPAASPPGLLPQARIGWFDANDYTFRLNQWLYQNARDRLPHEGDAIGFVRLPTEAEWEFAARGGTAVSDSDFRQPLFPMTEQLARYVWYFGPRSANGEAHPVGRLLPNPLGLYDIIGNVGQITLEPYRVNHGDRLHGQAGGFVVRGGDYLVRDTDMRASRRSETPHFSPDSGQPVRLATVGMRLVLSSVVSTSLQRTDEMRQAWDDAVERARAQRELNAGRPLNPDQDADALLRALIGQTQQQDLVTSLQRIQQALADERGARLNEQLAREAADGRSAYAAIDSGSILIRLMRDYDYRARALQSAADEVRRRAQPLPGDRQRMAELESNARTNEENQRDTVEAYLRLVNNTARTFPRTLLDAQIALWRREHTGPRFQKLPQFAQLFVDQTTQQREHPVANARTLVDAILALP